MAKRSEEHPPKISASAGRDITVVGRDYKSGNTVNFWMPLLFIGVVTFGALAWAFNVGLLKGSGNLQQPETTQDKGKSQ
jgi:hypothetical protein